MKTSFYTYKCSVCAATFDAPDTCPLSYGLFTMRTAGENPPVYVEAYSDAVFQEVSRLIDTLIPTAVGGFKSAEYLHKIFGAACDKAPDGSPYQLEKQPSCPVCGASEWQAKWINEERRTDAYEMASVTHHDWNQLTEVQKETVISQALSEVLAETKNSPRLI